MSYTTNCGIVSLLFFLLLSPQPSAAQAAAPNGGNPHYDHVSPSLAVILVGLIAVLFFIGVYSIYIRICHDNIRGSTVSGGAGRWLRFNRGLEASVMATFPTAVYSEVKVHKIGRGNLECAVCLNEYEDGETLRLIPKCDHVFHAECIEAWFASHSTCPVCRANLAPQTGEPVVSRPAEVHNTEIDLEAQNAGGDSEPEEERRINNNNVNSNAESQVPLEAGVTGLKRSRTHGPTPNRSDKPRLPRSHSTGHSVVQPGENTDRFTLRLPADVRNQLMSGKLNRATSFSVLPKESSSRRGYRDYGSSRGRSFGQFNKMDRWSFMSLPFLNRASSIKTAKVACNGEGTLNSPVGPAADSSRPQV